MPDRPIESVSSGPSAADVEQLHRLVAVGSHHELLATSDLYGEEAPDLERRVGAADRPPEPPVVVRHRPRHGRQCRRFYLARTGRGREPGGQLL